MTTDEESVNLELKEEGDAWSKTLHSTLSEIDMIFASVLVLELIRNATFGFFSDQSERKDPRLA